jgi:hypothetical protein
MPQLLLYPNPKETERGRRRAKREKKAMSNDGPEPAHQLCNNKKRQDQAKT